MTVGVLLGLAGATGAANAQIKKGVTVHLEEHEVEFEKLTPRCLDYCVEVTYERHSFECGVVLLPGYDGCDLPWLDPDRPTPDLYGQGELCIPSEAEFGGYQLHEDRELITEIVRHRANCTSTKNTYRQPLPDTNNPPDTCPGPNGVWSWDAPQVKSFRFVQCPAP